MMVTVMGTQTQVALQRKKMWHIKKTRIWSFPHWQQSGLAINANATSPNLGLLKLLMQMKRVYFLLIDDTITLTQFREVAVKDSGSRAQIFRPMGFCNVTAFWFWCFLIQSFSTLHLSLVRDTQNNSKTALSGQFSPVQSLPILKICLRPSNP